MEIDRTYLTKLFLEDDFIISNPKRINGPTTE